MRLCRRERVKMMNIGRATNMFSYNSSKNEAWELGFLDGFRENEDLKLQKEYETELKKERFKYFRPVLCPHLETCPDLVDPVRYYRDLLYSEYENLPIWEL